MRDNHIIGQNGYNIDALFHVVVQKKMILAIKSHNQRKCFESEYLPSLFIIFLLLRFNFLSCHSKKI
jgi:hypothetical protein